MSNRDSNAWLDVRRKARLANARHWLTEVEKSPDLAALLDSNYDNLLRAIEAVVEDEEAFDTTFRLLEALSLIVFGQADWDRWLVYLQRALVTAETLEKPLEQARLLELTASFVRFKGKIEQAIQHYQAAIKLFEELGDGVGQARTLIKLASILDRQDKLDEAKVLCQQALSLAQAAGAGQVVADAHLTLGGIYGHERDWRLALDEHQLACEQYRALGLDTFAARALTHITAYYARLGQWSEAKVAAREAASQMEGFGDIRGQIDLKVNLGFIAYSQGDYQAAEMLWQEGLQLQSQTQDPYMQAVLHNNLGKAYTQLGEWETAEQLLNQAAATHKSTGDDYAWGNTWDNLADLYEAKREWGSCRRVLQEGIDGLEEAAAEKPHCQRLRNTMIERLARLPESP